MHSKQTPRPSTPEYIQHISDFNCSLRVRHVYEQSPQQDHFAISIKLQSQISENRPYYTLRAIFKT